MERVERDALELFAHLDVEASTASVILDAGGNGVKVGPWERIARSSGRIAAGPVARLAGVSTLALP